MTDVPPLRLRGFRGATTVERDRPDEILDATDELLRALVEANAIDPADIVSAVFTVTQDLVSTFPARASQPYGWDQVAILHATEIPVPGSLPRCIRVLVHAYSCLAPAQIKHCYLRQAIGLRPDRAQP
jgi:monofunctional chorismate mutase